MSASHSDHSTDAVVAHHDPAEEIAHAKHHAVQNIFFFAGFFTFILLAVAAYFCYGVTNIWLILGLAAARSLLIAGFFAWLVGHFHFVVRTIVFTFVFFLGMIFLSMWDSTVPIYGNPISRPGGQGQDLFPPSNPPVPAAPTAPVNQAAPATPTAP